jgi:co-chaperonin GroES (HSP10)
MNLKPRNSYVLIELLPKETETTKTGIVIPEQAMRYQQPIGIVHEVGSEVESGLVGKKVIITNGGFKHSYLGKEYVLLHQSEALAIIDE